MGGWEITVIILLCILLLNPNDIKILTKNAINFIININKYLNSIKDGIIKSIDINNKK